MCCVGSDEQAAGDGGHPHAAQLHGVGHRGGGELVLREPRAEHQLPVQLQPAPPHLQLHLLLWRTRLHT